MKILYGVQGTGNGHITRARAMAVELARAGARVDYLFSGRPRDRLFDMEPFGDFQHREGLTFTVRDGRILPFATLKDSSPLVFVRDLRRLAVDSYDLILTDYEPVTAWAGKLRGKRVVGIGHQYAFRHAIPQHRGSPAQRWLMQYFAPAQLTLGLHWHHFDQPILPPIAPVESHGVGCERGQILTYLPFEGLDAITDLLEPFAGYRFLVYHPDADAAGDRHRRANIQWLSPCRDGFQRHLLRSEGVICNAGFELASEALQLGKKLLVKPVAGQPEQLSNALALELLGYGHTMDELDAGAVANWLTGACGTRIVYPNVAAAICAWLLDGAQGDVAELAASLWRQTVLPDLTPLTRTDASLASLSRNAEAHGGKTRRISHG